MELARRLSLLTTLAALAGLAGCLSLPPPQTPDKVPVGAKAPDFSLPRVLVTAGKDDTQVAAAPGKLSLADLTSNTTAVLVFYRGHW